MNATRTKRHLNEPKTERRDPKKDRILTHVGFSSHSREFAHHRHQTRVFTQQIVCASLHTADQRYFWFHHSDGDTMSVQNPEEMNLCSAVWAVVAYVVADLEEMLPR
ncbi:Carboxypeptidase Q [Anabarilius grahami]|uniref:Carboxypeptidase Q n=1 Tax=Anabarilius grahami TaxID=495550 RepID=A0A3N0YQN5_ANAGA|nr:Carboxypeptidase Q [Anabarilius grahami]